MSTSHRHRHHASTGQIPSQVRHRLALDDRLASSSAARPQPELREEDECPICHSALPPKGPDGSEARREQHVTECIESHFSSSSPRTAQPHPSSRLRRQGWQARPPLHKLGPVRFPASVRAFKYPEMCRRRPSCLDVERQEWLSTTPARRIAWAKMARVLKNA